MKISICATKLWDNLIIRREQIARYVPYIVISLFGLGIHGLLLLNDGIYWDDWRWITALKEKNWNIIYTIGFARGIPLDSYFLWFFSRFQNIEFAHRFVAFLCILLSTQLVYAICSEAGMLTRGESLWVALISMVYPAFQTRILLSTTNCLFYYMLFLGGVFLALKSQNNFSVRKYALRFSALILFFLSFSLASLLVFYFGFLLLLPLFVRQLKALSVKEMLTRFLPRQLDYILLPFVYWIVKGTFFPVYGDFTYYNQIAFPLNGTLALKAIPFLYNGIFQHFYAPLRFFFTKREAALLVLVSIFWIIKYSRDSFLSKLMRSYGILIYGLILLSLGMFPYIVVGKIPTLTGWTTRFNLLLALPVALLTVVVVRVFFGNTKKGVSRSESIILMLLFLTFCFSTVSTYIDQQARWVKDRSSMLNLGQLDGAGNYSVYWIDDKYPLGGEVGYNFYEWASMFQEAWGGKTRIGIDVNYNPGLRTDWPSITKSYYLSDLSGFDPAGCQATVQVQQATSIHSEAELVGRYFYFKFLRPQDMQHFLNGITQIKVEALPSPLAVNCSQ